MYLEVLSSLFTLENLLWINVGLAGGIVVGALPGLTGTMAMALLLPPRRPPPLWTAIPWLRRATA